MITYEPPEQQEVNVGDHVEGIGTVMDPDNFEVTESPQRPVAEFDELIKDAPRFHAMGNGELIAYAYGMLAAGKKIEADNAKLRELVRELWTYTEQVLVCDGNCSYGAVCDWKDCVFEQRMRELGVEVD